MVVDIEVCLFVNLFLNLCILKLTGLFLRENIKHTFLSALFGSVVALFVPLMDNEVFLKILLQIFVGTIMTSISFNYQNLKGYIVSILSLLLMTFLIGGGCFALQNIIGVFPIFVCAIVGSFIFMITKFLIKYNQKKSIITNFTYDVSIKNDDKIIFEQGFLDSGNMLYDNILKKPVVLINYDCFNKIYNNISFFDVFSKKIDKLPIKNAHLIKIQGITSPINIIAFTVDELVVGSKKSFKNAVLGLSFSGFEKSFGKNILLHSEVV